MPSFATDSPQRVFLHVGLPTTGTTGLQDRLWRNRDEALALGVFYPGDDMAAHFHAAAHLQPDRYLDWVDPAHTGIWQRLVRQMREWPGTSVISHELFASATPEQAAQVRADLSFAQVHIVVTARDLGRQIPSTWQENVKNQHTTAFPEFLRLLDQPKPDLRDPFWEFQDLIRILDTWAADIPPERVHVVTVPAPGAGRDELWQRFVSVFGLTAAQLPQTIESENSALSMGQIELLRRLNERLQPEHLHWSRYEAAVKGFLIGDVMFASPARGGPTLPAEAFAAVTERSRAVVAEIRARGYAVTGDLDDLLPVAPRESSPVPDNDELLDLALDTLAQVMLVMPLPEPRKTPLDRMKPMLRRNYRRLDATRRRINQRMQRRQGSNG